MTDFPTFLYTSTRVAKEQEHLRYNEIPTLFIYLSLKKVPLWGRASPYKPLKGEPLGYTIHKHSTRGRDLVYQTYQDFHVRNPPIATHFLRQLQNLILKKNSIHFNGQHYLQTLGKAMGR